MINGFEEEGISYWHERCAAVAHINTYYAQVLAQGLWFDATKEEATNKISEFLGRGVEEADLKSLTAMPPVPEYNFL